MDTSITRGMCRCCASEGAFKDIKSSYTWMGEEEVYADMLKECFDVHLSSTPTDQYGGICEVCITQLRNASNFKKQVLRTEDQLKRLEGKFFTPGTIKIEYQQPEDSQDNTDDNDDTEGYSGNEFDVPIKSEVIEDKPKKRTRATTSRAAKKPKATEADASSTRALRSRVTKTTDASSEEDEKITLNRKTNFSYFISIRHVGKKSLPQVREKQRKAWKKRRLAELDLHFDNIKTIIKCSNATPVRCRVDDRFACSFCLEQYHSPVDLKSHSLEAHERDRPDFLRSNQPLTKLLIILDVTQLECKLCGINIDTLELLMDHLKINHDELIHTQIKNQIVPVKFVGANSLCAVCGTVIEDLNRIHEHMSLHYNNYVCEFCSEGFVNKGYMIEHKKIVHRV